MAQHESDREDLMQEATALIRRAELMYPGCHSEEPVIAGFRRDGRLALYFGADPVYQFDPQNRLRRAYVSGFLYRTQGETLARLSRNRTETETQLLRHDLNSAELADFRETATHYLTPLRDALALGNLHILKQVSADAEIRSDLEFAVNEILDREIPLAPAIPGKR